MNYPQWEQVFSIFSQPQIILYGFIKSSFKLPHSKGAKPASPACIRNPLPLISSLQILSWNLKLFLKWLKCAVWGRKSAVSPVWVRRAMQSIFNSSVKQPCQSLSCTKLPWAVQQGSSSLLSQERLRMGNKCWPSQCSLQPLNILKILLLRLHN